MEVISLRHSHLPFLLYYYSIVYLLIFIFSPFPSWMIRLQVLEKQQKFKSGSTVLSLPIIPQPQPLEPYPALCCLTLITSPDLRTTPVSYALTRTNGRNSAESLSSTTPCMRRKRASTSASACPWAAKWAPTSQLQRSPSWQTVTMVSDYL